jgi:hypothetical protein
VGFANLGGTCFKNAVAQAMFRLTPYDLATRWLPVIQRGGRRAPRMTTTGNLGCFLHEVRVATDQGTCPSISPHKLASIFPPPAHAPHGVDYGAKYPREAGVVAEWYDDVMELMGGEVDAWKEEHFDRVPAARALTTAFGEAFGGRMAAQYRCAACKAEAPARTQPFWSYLVPLPAGERPLQECLGDLNAWALLNRQPDPRDPWSCNLCFNRQREVRDGTVCAMPEAFVVQLKRLTTTGFDATAVAVEDTLDVRPLLAQQDGPNHVAKTLQAVVRYLPRRVHYEAYVRDTESPGRWWRISDATVQAVPAATVTWESRTSAVMLFYT